MDLDFSKIFYPIVTLVIGFFLRDLYTFVKKKFIKAEKPKIHIEYSCKYYSSHGSNPRSYKFHCILIVQNIDTIPIYDVKVFKYVNNDEKSTPFLIKVSLIPNEKIEFKEDAIVSYGDGNTRPEEANKLLSPIFRDPKIQVHFKNKEGKIFKESWKNISSKLPASYPIPPKI